MNYYLLAPLGLNSPPLAYACESKLQNDDICHIDLIGKGRMAIVLSSIPKPLEFECKEALPSTAFFLPFQKILASFIAQYYCVGLGESFGLFTPLDPGLDSESESALDSASLESVTFGLKTLSAEQTRALEFIQNQKNPLLFGDTGSGKTEIYIHLIAQVLEQGKNALFLMPEISLTPQMETRLKSVFGDLVAIWHSKITKSKKLQILKNMLKGKVRVIAGARSALFLPIDSLGLVIVDEEHDEAYKSQSRPRYHARDMALYLGSKTDIKVVLGSATPSLGSYYHSVKNQAMVRLKGRYFDSKKHFYFEDRFSSENELSDVIAKIKQALVQKGQVIVFLPTRAHYKMLICSSCGNGVQCEFCSVNMSLHLSKNALVCHYCHWTKPIPTQCPSCHAYNLQARRIGTAEVASLLQEELAGHTIALFDRDHITTHKQLTTTLKKFNDGEIDVLVGTQMLSKGHDYHRVNLVVVLGIDYILASSDYRANERVVSLLHQIAGRSGRKDDGEVYIQSKNTQLLQPFMQDYEDFLRYELTSRPHLYPPYCRLATIIFSHKIESKALEALDFVRQILNRFLRQGAGEVEIVGDCKAVLERLQGKYRFILLLRSTSAKALLECLQFVISQSSVQLQQVYEIDVDPLSVV